MQRILKSYLFWTYPRGSFHYDVMVTLILVFLFVSPRLINYRDRPQETLTSTKEDRKSTRLNSSHQIISYAVFCLKKKKNQPPCIDSVEQEPGVSRSIAVRLQSHAVP